LRCGTGEADDREALRVDVEHTEAEVVVRSVVQVDQLEKLLAPASEISTRRGLVNRQSFSGSSTNPWISPVTTVPCSSSILPLLSSAGVPSAILDKRVP